jgi:hypothetical protein
MAEHLLDDGQGDALAEGDGGRAVPHGVHAVMRQSGSLQDVRPLLPVGALADRPPVRLAEHEIVVFPDVRRGEPFGGLRCPVRLQDG